jgi:ectoine hydroxylase-related dioxygenase (phytanoyl-CoA dioxygenase family)
MRPKSQRSLANPGFVVLPRLLSPPEVTRVRRGLAPLLAKAPLGRNPFEGERTQRVYGLLGKTRALDFLVEHPAVLAVVDANLESALLSAALTVRLLPGAVPQPWHADGAFYPVPRPRAPIGVSTIWALDDFNEDNGATLVLPRSHLWGDALPRRPPRPERLLMPKGSVAIFPDTLYHASGENRSPSPRLGLTIQYCQGWARTIENMCLAVSPRVVARLSSRMQELLGYAIFPPFIGYVDGRHPKKLLARHARD